MLGVQVSPLLPSLVRVALLLVGFVLPGYGVAAWLLAPPTTTAVDEDRIGLRVLLGFVLSFALFALLTAPSLWLGHSYAAVQGRVLWSWLGYALFGLLGLWRAHQAATSTLPTSTTASVPSQMAQGVAQPQSDPLAGLRLLPSLGYFALGLLGIVVYAQHEPARVPVLSLLPVLVAFGLWRFRRYSSQRTDATADGRSDATPAAARREPRGEDLRRPPRSWQALALAAVALQGGLMTLYDRPDWDDCYYLAAALDYPQATSLNQQEPTHREGLAVPPQQRTLCWVLWGAMLSHLSGVSPMGLFRSVLPLGLLPLLYIAYATLLSRLLIARFVPLGIVLLSLVHTVGIGHHDGALNFALPRLGQGKAVLLHIALPLLSALLLRIAASPARPSLRQVSAVLVTVLFAIGVSLSALFLGVALLCSLGLALLWAEPSWRRRLQLAGVLSLSVAPLFAVGLWLRPATQADALLVSTPAVNTSWLSTLIGYLGSGTSELLWVLLLPVLAFLVRRASARTYLLVFPACLLAGIANPLLFHVVARSLSSYPTYLRILWLFPVGVGLSVAWVLGCVALADSLRQAQRGPAFLHAPLPWIVAAGLFFGALPGLFVFGPKNSFIGPLGTPHRTQNFDRLPEDLRPLAWTLLQAADGSQRILCNEQVASFLAPFADRLRFVQTRTSYTAIWFATAGRTLEGVERAFLGSLPRVGDLGGPHEAENWLELRMTLGDTTLSAAFAPAMAQASRDLRTLLARYRVRYVVLGPGDRGADTLRALGYTTALSQGRFLLLQAPEPLWPSP